MLDLAPGHAERPGDDGYHLHGVLHLPRAEGRGRARHGRGAAAPEARRAGVFDHESRRPEPRAAQPPAAAAFPDGVLNVLRKLVAFILLLAASLGAAAQGVKLVDRIVAIVNKEVITYSELNKAVASAERELRRQGAQPPANEILERQMLERLILDKAQLQMAKETGIRVDDLQVDRTVERVAEQNKMTLSQFRTALQGDGVPFDAF